MADEVVDMVDRGFQLTFSDTSYSFLAESQQSMTSWIDALNSQLELQKQRFYKLPRAFSAASAVHRTQFTASVSRENEVYEFVFSSFSFDFSSSTALL
eukprot:m.162516 g.162516  ORF g.162516 m.162516 type:complete len:98 (-) comp53062_c0_seq20:3241-3534(-)